MAGKTQIWAAIIGGIFVLIGAIVGPLLTIYLKKTEPQPPQGKKIAVEPRESAIIEDITTPEQEPTQIKKYRRKDAGVEELQDQKLAIGKRLEIDEKERRLSEFKSLINWEITTHPGVSNVAIIIESKKTESGISPSSALYNLLRVEQVNLIINLFQEESFRTRGFFKEIYDGNTELLHSSGALSEIDYLILGSLNYSFRKGIGLDSDLLSCDINFAYKVINKNGNVVKSDSISIIGPGFSEDAALERGLEILSAKYSDRILEQP